MKGNKSRKRVSLKDIAAELKVSTAVVSYVLNNKHEGRVSEEKAQQIRDVAKRLNYFPDQIAKSLRSDKTMTIGLIIADIANLFYSNIVRYIENSSNKHQYHVIVSSTDENPEKFNKLVQVMLNRKVDGMIVAPPKGVEDTLTYLRDEQIPFVVIDRFFPEVESICTVGIDNFQASYSVVRHVAENGYRKPAMVTLHTDLYHMQQRAAGFQAGASELLKITQPQVLHIDEQQLSDNIESVICQLLNDGTDLIYFSTNRIAMEGLAVLVNHKIAVPQQIGVVCFDEADAYKIFYTSITFVQQPLQQIGSKSVDMLITSINGTVSIKNVALDTQIIAHGSSARRMFKPNESDDST